MDSLVDFRFTYLYVPPTGVGRYAILAAFCQGELRFLISIKIL